MSSVPRRKLALLGALCLALAACAGPVGAKRVDPKIVHHDLGRSAVATNEPSIPTRNVLFERGLFEAFDTHPEAAIAELHRAMVASQGDPDLLFALAELSFLHGQAATKPDYSLAAAVYAFAFLFPEDTGGAAPGRFDPRVRIAADLYNWALTAAFTSGDKAEVVPRGGAFTLPLGRIDVAFDPAQLRAGDRELYRLIPVAELEVYGLQMRYRWPGLGAPLAASTRPIDASRPGGHGGPAPAGPGDRPSPDPRRAARARAGPAAHGHAGDAPRLGDHCQQPHACGPDGKGREKPRRAGDHPGQRQADGRVLPALPDRRQHRRRPGHRRPDRKAQEERHRGRIRVARLQR